MSKTYRFTAAALLYLIRIVNLWPAPNRAALLAVARLGDKLDLTDEERETIGWKEVSQGGFEYQPDTVLSRELTDEEAESLVRMVENPPERAAWTRATAPIMDAILRPLGRRGWLAEQKEQKHG